MTGDSQRVTPQDSGNHLSTAIPTSEAPHWKPVAALAICVWGIAVVLLFVYSEYLERGRFSTSLSFYSPDPPGNIPIRCLPRPFGVHYFGDFVSAACHSRLPSPYRSDIISNYFPFSYVAIAPFGVLLRFGLGAAIVPFLLVSTAAIVIPIFLSFRSNETTSDRILAILILVLITYPFISLIDRGNMQGLVTGALLWGVYFWKKDRGLFSALFFAIAVALKGYPIFFLILFVQKRQWRALAVAIMTTGLLTVLPMLTFQGGLQKNTRSLIDQLRTFTVGGEVWLHYNNSLKGFLLAMNELSVPFINSPAKFFAAHYFAVVLVLAAVLFFLAVNSRTDLFQFTLLGSIFCSFLIDLSAGYVLTAFFVPLMVYISSESHSCWIRKTQIILLVLLLAPKGIPILGFAQNDRASWNTLLNPVLQMLLLALSILWTLTRRIESREK